MKMYTSMRCGKTNMITNIFFFICLINIDISNACDFAQPLQDLPRRARNYQALGDYGNDPYISDEYLGPGWFSVGEYKMPDSNTKPKSSFCGTNNPIYVKGTHPEISTLTDSSVSLVACEKFPFDECLNEINIEVRKCDDGLQYYLRGTSTNFAYCMDPPELQNVTDFASAPTDVNIEGLSVKPMLAFNVQIINGGSHQIPYNRYECVESSTVERSGISYSTYWFVDSNVIEAFERKGNITHLTDFDLINNGLGFGVAIQCGVRLSISTSPTGLQTPIVTSKPYFIGVNVTDVVNVEKNGTANIILNATIPLGCYEEIGKKVTGACDLGIVMYYPDATEQQCKIDDTLTGVQIHQLNDRLSKCGVQIKGFYPHDITAHNQYGSMEPVSMTITSAFFSNTDPTHFKLGLITKGSESHAIWKDQSLHEVQVNIITSKSYQEKMCYAKVDPHMCTADGKAYEHNKKGGDFILYRHVDNKIEVQMRTVSCNNNIAFCACAVSVRAGGDVFLINLCGGLEFMEMTSCKDGGNLVIQKYTEFNYQILTNIGTLIKVDIVPGKYKNLLNVYVHLAPKDFGKIEGLCGTFDGNKYNDFHDRDGNTVGTDTFIDAWEINDNDVNMLNPTCTVDVPVWQTNAQMLYCTCECSFNNSCGDLSDIATCATSQYVNCSVDRDITSELCRFYHEKLCPTNRRRSVYNDHEEEMKRLSELARRPHRYISKRDLTNSTEITSEMAWNICFDTVNTDMTTKFAHLLGGFNLTQTIVECAWDVHTGQDPGWAEVHKQAAESAIEIGFKRDANYTLSHQEELKEFKRNTCPYNCSGNGICQENGKY